MSPRDIGRRIGFCVTEQPKRVLLAMVAISLAITAVHRGPLSAAGDAPDYLAAAYHLFHQHVFTQAVTPLRAPPGIGREPAYAMALAGLMAIDPVLRSFTPDCLEAPCNPTIYRSVALLNLAMTILSGVLIYWLGARVTKTPVGGLAAAGYVLFNLQTNKGWGPVASDRLAVLAVVLVLLAVSYSWARNWPRWVLTALALALLTLTKAIFLYYTILGVVAALVVAVLAQAQRRTVGLPLAGFLLVYGAIIGGWTIRNEQISSHWQLTDSRGGIALNTREVFNHMNAEQYAASFLYWMRGPGEGLARKYFPPAVTKPFDLEQPGGFYDVGQNGFGTRVTARMAATGADYWTAEKSVEREIQAAILSRPLTHLATTLPLFYRGLWGDEFIVLGLPLFVMAWIAAIRERNLLMLCLLSIGAFNLLFYAAFSLNIPRYQATALPSMALGVGYMAARWHRSRLTAI